jgi:hypothetical protein
MSTMKSFRFLHLITASFVMLAACQQGAHDQGDSDDNDQAVSVGTARLTISGDASAAACAKVSAKEAVSGKLIQEALVKLGEQASVELALPAGSYVLDIQAFADKAASALLCSRSAKIDVGARATANVDVKLIADGKGSVDLGINGDGGAGANLGAGAGGNASGNAGGATTAGGSVSGGAMAGGSVMVGGGAMAGGSAGGSATAGGSTAGGSVMVGGSVSGGATGGTGGSVSGGAMVGGSVSGGTMVGGSVSGGTMVGGTGGAGGAPGGSTSVGGSVSGGATAGGTVSLSTPSVQGVEAVMGQLKVKLTVKATASDGGSLSFVWSGAGCNGATVGSASAELDVAAILASTTHITKILVQTKDGVASEVKVKFDCIPGLLGGVLKLAGTVSTTVCAIESLATSLAACVDVHAQCTAACAAALKAGACSVEAHAACMVDCQVKLSTCCGPS